MNVISAISPKGELRFMATENNVNAKEFCKFLSCLLADANAPVFLIVDNHPVHRSEEVQKFVIETEGKLKIFYLPPYSPELNPDELVWNYLKNHHTGRMSHGGKKEFHVRVITIMQSLQQLKDKVRVSSATLSSSTPKCSVIYALVNMHLFCSHRIRPLAEHMFANLWTD